MEFINQFFKGLNSDYNLVLQPEGTYRYMKNCQLLNQDGNNYVVKDCLGNVLTFTINPPYDSVYTVVGTVPSPLAFISFPDKLIVLSTNNNTDPVTSGYLEIGKIEYLPYGNGIMPKTTSGQYNAGYIPLYHHYDLRGSILHRIEGFAFSENELIERIYFTDNFNGPRVFNVSDPTFTTYFTTGTLVVGNQYMVLEGAVTHNGTNYGPGLTAGNVFTAANANFTDLTTPTPTAKVIAYYPYQLLDWTPSRSLANIKFVEYGSGNVYCGNKMYFYRLSTGDGAETTWSYGCAPIHVGTTNDPNVGSIPYYHNFVGGGTTTSLLNSGYSVTVRVAEIDTNFTYIELACAEFDESITTFRQITIVAKEAITSSSMTLTHTGNDNLGDLTLGDVTLFPASILTVKTLGTDKNYNIVGNITERGEFDFSKDNLTVTQVEYPMNVHGDPDSCTIGGMVYQGAWPVDGGGVPSVGTNPAAGTVTPWSRYYVILGNLTTDQVSYNGNFYITGDVIVGVAGFDTITFGGSSQAWACVSKNKYDSVAKFGGTTPVRVEDAIVFTDVTNNGFWTYKNPAVHHAAQGYWSDETYRYGILFYDLKGNPFYVKHLDDYTFQKLVDKGGALITDLFGATNMYSLNPSLLSISGIEITQEIADEVSGWSIVRAERDPIIVTQGLVTQVSTDGGAPAIYRPGAWVPMTGDVLNMASTKYVYLCPDNLVNVPLKASFGQVGDKMEEACWYNPHDYQGGGLVYVKGDGGVASEQVYTKFLEVLATDNTAREKEITYFGYTNEAQTLTDLGGGETFDNSSITTGAAGVTAVEGACVTGSADYNLAGHAYVGCKKIMFELDSDFLQYGPSAHDYTDNANERANPTKIVMNYKKANKTVGSLYGGSGDSALANTLYISTGHFQPINSTVLADTLTTRLSVASSAGFVIGNGVLGLASGKTGTIVDIRNNNIYIKSASGIFTVGETIKDTTSLATSALSSSATIYLFNNVEVAGGDCFVNLVDIGYGLWADTFGVGTRMSYSWTFACENNSNYDLRRGRKTSNVKMYCTGASATEAISFLNPSGVPVLEDFSYNEGYSSEGQAIRYPALPVNFVNATRFNARIRYAGVKFIGESTDSFRVFALNDYKDFAYQNGKINNIKVKDQSVIVWQDLSVNSTPVLERQLLAAPTGDATTIGVGGVIDRFDVLSSYFGNQHQWSVVETEYGFLWFDMHRKGVVMLGFDGSGLVEPSLVGGLQNFFNEVFVEDYGATTLDNTKLLNSPTFSETSDRPLTGVGITGVYDPKFKMTYLTFKFFNQKSTDGFWSKDFTIGYLHDRLDKFFVGFYDWFPQIAHNHNGFVISSNNPKCTTQYIPASGPAGLTFAAGETLPYLGVEYICKAAVTLSAATYYPDGATGATYWTLLNKPNQLWVHNQPATLGANPAPDYLYNKFFGRVVDNQIDVIVNPQTPESFYVAAMEQHGPYNVNYTSIQTDAINQSAADNSIRGTDINYLFTYDKIKSSLPRTSLGQRIINRFLRIKLIKKNWTTVPTTITTSVKILEKLKSFITLMR